MAYKSKSSYPKQRFGYREDRAKLKGGTWSKDFKALETELIFYKHGKTFACILNLRSWEILHLGEKIPDRSQRAEK